MAKPKTDNTKDAFDFFKALDASGVEEKAVDYTRSVYGTGYPSEDSLKKFKKEEMAKDGYIPPTPTEIQAAIEKAAAQLDANIEAAEAAKAALLPELQEHYTAAESSRKDSPLLKSKKK